jgi:hypothetical protein
MHKVDGIESLVHSKISEGGTKLTILGCRKKAVAELQLRNSGRDALHTANAAKLKLRRSDSYLKYSIFWQVSVTGSVH